MYYTANIYLIQALAKYEGWGGQDLFYRNEMSLLLLLLLLLLDEGILLGLFWSTFSIRSTSFPRLMS